MLINTTKGKIDDSELIKKTGRDHGDSAMCDWVEYWIEDELVHRSINVTVTGVDNKAEAYKM